jgi:uncharacterized protein (TIRG00374 family)
VKNKLLAILKVFASVLFLYIAARSVDLSKVINLVSGAEIKFFVLAFLIFSVGQVASSMRCAYIARGLGYDLPFLISAKANFIGLFFNQLLPTSMGGDVVKVAILGEMLGFGAAVKTALLDRLSGFVILILSLALALPFYFYIIPKELQAIYFLLVCGILCFSFFVVILIFVSSKVGRKFERSGFISKFFVFSGISIFLRGRPASRQLSASLIVHCSGIVAYYLLGASIGLNVEFLGYFLVVPLIFLVGFFPISYAGWGVR